MTTISECSVWCQPEKGMHTFVDYSVRDTDPVVGEWVMQDENTCVGRNTLFELLSTVRASEAPPCPDPDYPYAFLWTVQVITEHAPAGAQ